MARRHLLVAVLTTALMSAVLIGHASAPAGAATLTYVVNDLGNGPDATPGDDLCATSGGMCTLRAAIIEANANAADDNRIHFGIQGTISVPGGLNPVTDPGLLIDGTTAPGFTVGAPTVTVLGTIPDLSSGPAAIEVSAANFTLKGLRFGKWVRALKINSSGSGAVVEGNQFGTNGSAFSSTLEIGTGIGTYAPNTRVGGPTAAQRNQFAGFVDRAVDVESTATNTLIEGNYIGTNAAGTAAVAHPQGTTGLIIDGQETLNVGIDAASPSLTIRGNLISGNPGFGIGTSHGGVSTIVGNLIGTDVTGTLPLPNTGIAVASQGTGHMQVGGTAPGDGNLIAATKSVNIENFEDGDAVQVQQGATATVQGNWIGTNSTGATGLASDGNGIQVKNNGSSAIIGGTAAGAGNTIVGGAGVGIRIDGTVAGQTAQATIQGNRIGTNPAGTAAVGSSTVGVLVDCGAKATIGGTAAGAGNVISGHSNGGILFCDSRKASTIQGNRIGTNAAGTGSIPNARGLRIFDVPTTGLGATPLLIGGTAAGAGNQFSGNTRNGLEVSGPVIVQGNLIGTDPAGNAAVPNGDYGMEVGNAAATIGGTAAGAGNLISGNTRGGITVAAANGTVVQGNRIGTNAAGTGPLGNGFAGLLIHNGTGLTIGGTGAGEANTIAFNNRQGVFVGPGASGVSIRGNRIHTNTNQAIELYQYGQIEGGGNKDQVPPTMTATLGAQTAVSGTIVSTVAGSLPVDLYASNVCGPEGAGEGKEWLGTITVNHPGGGAAQAFAGNLPLPSNPANNIITGTATVTGKGTSQHSHCRNVSDLEVKGSANASTIPIGSEVGVLMTVTNKGPTPLTGVVIDVQPDVGPTRGADTYLADVPSKGTLNTGTDKWTIGSMASGEAATVCLRLTPARAITMWPGMESTYQFAHDDPYWGNDLWQERVDVGPKVADANVCALPTVSVGDAQLTRPTSGTATMTFPVTLSAEQTRDVKVKYATQNGTAAAVIDFTDTTGTLTIPAGETTGEIEVPIVGNQSDEPDKAFTVLLSQPEKATIADGTATGTIKANGALAGCPVDADKVEAFVCHLYWDALGRAAESGGFNYWVGRINRGDPRSNMIKTYLSQPRVPRRVQVDRVFVFYLGRHGSNSELTSFADKLAAKTITPEAIRIQLLASGEYYTGAGATSATWVTSVYRDVFRRSPDSGGQAFWVGKLTAGQTRSQVAKAMLTQDEGRRRVVDDIFLRFLRRFPPMAESMIYVNQMKAGKTEADVANGVAASAEYFNRP